MKRLAVMMMAVIGVSAVAARPAAACVSGCFDIFLSFPAITCAGDGFTRSGGGIFNFTTGSKWIMCPVPANSKTDFGRFASSMSINVTAGTSCFAVAGDAAANIWSVPPSVTKTFTGFVELDWGWNDLSGSGGRNLSIQCFVPTNGRVSQYFVETIWEGQ